MTPTPPTKQTFDENGNSTRDVVFDGPTHTFQGRTSPALAELMDEFRAMFITPVKHELNEYGEYEGRKKYSLSEMESFLAKTFAAGRKAELMEVREMMPDTNCPESCTNDSLSHDGARMGKEHYQFEFLARIDKKINSLK